MWRDAEDGTPLCNACGIRYDATPKAKFTDGTLARLEKRQV